MEQPIVAGPSLTPTKKRRAYNMSAKATAQRKAASSGRRKEKQRANSMPYTSPASEVPPALEVPPASETPLASDDADKFPISPVECRREEATDLNHEEGQLLDLIRFVARDEAQKVLAEIRCLPQQPSSSSPGMNTAVTVAGPIILLLLQSALQAGLPQAALGELIKKGLRLMSGDGSAEQPSLLPPSDSQPVSPSAESVV